MSEFENNETMQNTPDETAENKDIVRQKSWKYITDINSVSKERLDRTALITTNRTYTYRQMFRNWDKYAEVFSALGITGENRSRIAVFDCSCVETSFAFYAANMTGASVAGFAPAYLSEKFPLGKAVLIEGITDLFINDLVINDKLLVNILKQKKDLGLRNIIIVHVRIDGENEDAELVRLSKANYESLKKVKGALFMDDLIAEYEAYPITYSTADNDPEAFVLHTSGTTKGISKPAPLSDHAVNIAADNMKKSGKFEKFENGSVTLCSMAGTSVYGFVNQLHEPLAFGCTVVLPPMSTTNPNFVKFIGQYKVNILFLTPFYFEVWAKMPPELVPDFTSVKCVVIGGAYLSAEARKRYKAFAKQHGGEPFFINGYGMSETCGACIIQTEEVENDSIGYPLPGVTVRVYDESEEKFYTPEEGHTGVLYIHSESLSLGKLGDTEFFKVDEIDGEPYICTNDIVSINDDGSLACQGRANRYFVNNDGIKFDAGIVETLVSAEEGIESCAITPWYDKLLTHDTVPVLYVQTVEQGQSSPVTVRNALIDVFIKQEKAKETNLPMQCVITPQIPHNANGKVDIYKITNGGVPGDRYIVRPIRENNVLKDIILEYTNDSEEGLANGAVPEELTTVWDNVRESVMDETVFNQASNVFNARLMSTLAGAAMPDAMKHLQWLMGAFNMIWSIQQQIINSSVQIIQNAVTQYMNQMPPLPQFPQPAQAPQAVYESDASAAAVPAAGTGTAERAARSGTQYAAADTAGTAEHTVPAGAVYSAVYAAGRAVPADALYAAANASDALYAAAAGAGVAETRNARRCSDMSVLNLNQQKIRVTREEDMYENDREKDDRDIFGSVVDNDVCCTCDRDPCRCRGKCTAVRYKLQ